MPSLKDTDVELKKHELAISARSIAFNLLAAVIGAVFTFLGLVATGYFTWWKDSKEVDLKMIDIALGILIDDKEKADDSQPKEARRFAIEILKVRSGIRMDDEIWEGWIESEIPLTIPQSPSFGGFGAAWNPFSPNPPWVYQTNPFSAPYPSEATKEEWFLEYAFELSLHGKWSLLGYDNCVVEFAAIDSFGVRRVKVTDPCAGTPVQGWYSYSASQSDASVTIRDVLGAELAPLSIQSIDGKTLLLNTTVGVTLSKEAS